MMDGSTQKLYRLPLQELHETLGARMVPFAGYRMPVHYPAGILREHLHTREQAGLFDVSHMGQIVFRGNGADLESLMPADLVGLEIGAQTYTVLTNANGGILDDLIVLRRAEKEYLLIVNAACKGDDLEHFRRSLPDCEFDLLGDHALLALQGPAARAIMGELAPETMALVFMRACETTVDGILVQVSCSGYTGEDGFEISVPATEAERVARRLLEFEAVLPVGLGARDSLRLEAGLCLYGHDLDVTTTPVEAGIAWSVARARRRGAEREGGFPGAEIILEQMASGVGQTRVGLRVDGRVPVREGCDLLVEGIKVGRVCSGGFGPTVGAPVAMAYVDSRYAGLGTTLQAEVRGKQRDVVVARMPFVARHYYRGG